MAEISGVQTYGHANGAAIRIEKQTSYSAGSKESQNSVSGATRGEAQEEGTPNGYFLKVIEPFSTDEQAGQNQRTKIKLLPPPFEINDDHKTHHQQTEMANQMSYNESASELESIDVRVSPPRVLATHTGRTDAQGPPMQGVSKTQSQTTLIRPLMDSNLKPIRSNMYEEMIGSMEISFLQQLIDTRGPTNDTYQNYSNSLS